MRVFKFLTGKLTRVFDESLQTFSELQQMRQQLPDMEFGRRMAAERDLQKSEAFSHANIGKHDLFEINQQRDLQFLIIIDIMWPIKAITHYW